MLGGVRQKLGMQISSPACSCAVLQFAIRTLAVVAVQHVRRMRGGAQGHLMRCSDGNFYVVKFRNNPQHLRVLANEMLATRLAEAAGLPVPGTEVVEVGDWLVEHTPELSIQLAGNTIPLPGGTAIWIAVCGESAGRPGVRLSSDGDAGAGAESGNVCRNAGDG